MHRVLVDRDGSYEGMLNIAVKTSEIFCRPASSARKPKVENVEFFRTIEDVILKGYKPCKVCNSSENLTPFIK